MCVSIEYSKLDPGGMSRLCTNLLANPDMRRPVKSKAGITRDVYSMHITKLSLLLENIILLHTEVS